MHHFPLDLIVGTTKPRWGTGWPWSSLHIILLMLVQWIWNSSCRQRLEIFVWKHVHTSDDSLFLALLNTLLVICFLFTAWIDPSVYISYAPRIIHSGIYCYATWFFSSENIVDLLLYFLYTAMFCFRVLELRCALAQSILSWKAFFFYAVLLHGYLA